MRDYMKALCYRFETTSRRAECLDRKVERTYRQLSRLLDEPERKLLLKMADLEDALREEACLNSFISGYSFSRPEYLRKLSTIMETQLLICSPGLI